VIAVGFNLDHTLCTDNELERTAFVRISGAHAARSGYVQDDERAGVALDRSLADFISGRATVDEAIKRAFTLAGQAGPDAIAEFRTLALTMASRNVRALPGVADVLAFLDVALIPYAILTNGWSPLQEIKASLIGARCPVLVSAQIGTRKPLPEAFYYLADSLRVEPKDTWFVGNDPHTDIAGALNAGMTAIWYNPERRRYPADIEKPTHEISTMIELTAILQLHGNVRT
jgi:HAD superfamily hydrolase (TIGR01509 family)